MFSSIWERLTAQYRTAVFGIHGYFNFTKAGFEAASKSFDPLALQVDLTGKTAIVTGANSGIGRIAALELSKRGALVIMVCRNPQRGEEAKEALQKESGHPLELAMVDMSEPLEIKTFAEQLKNQGTSVDILVNNAGVLLNERTENSKGIETTFATNTLGVYYLTELLMDSLAASKGRVVT